MTPVPTAATRLAVLLGHPVAHSISPQLHNAAFAAAAVDAVYVACDVAPEHLAAAVDAVRALGVLGANVTVPHKVGALALADEATEEADLVGAANTLFWREGRLVADNTDARGLSDVLDGDIGLAAGDGVVLFGAGGAARAAAVALGRAGARLEVVARRPDAGREVGELAQRTGATLVAVSEPRLVVNATPLGLRGENLPPRLLSLGEGQVGLDLVYGREPTPWLAHVGSAGARTVDGRSMLVAQAERAFERWTGAPPPAGVMASAAAGALGDTA